MIVALVDGLSLHQLSAYEPVVDRMGPAFLLATSAATLTLPTVGAPPRPPGAPTVGP